jgi:hypothetical protein
MRRRDEAMKYATQDFTRRVLVRALPEGQRTTINKTDMQSLDEILSNKGEGILLTRTSHSLHSRKCKKDRADRFLGHWKDAPSHPTPYIKKGRL